MEKELITSHVFDIEDAKKYGIKAAVILYNIKFWVDHNSKSKSEYHFKEGRYWTFNSRSSFQLLFPYFKDKEIRLALQKLIDEKVLLVGNFNKKAYDKTRWFTLTDGYINSIQTLGLKGQPMRQKGQPIPDVNTDINKKLQENAPEGANSKIEVKPNSKALQEVKKNTWKDIKARRIAEKINYEELNVAENKAEYLRNKFGFKFGFKVEQRTPYLSPQSLCEQYITQVKSFEKNNLINFTDDLTLWKMIENKEWVKRLAEGKISQPEFWDLMKKTV